MIEVTKKLIRFILQNKSYIPNDKEEWPASWKTIESKKYERPIKIIKKDKDTKNFLEEFSALREIFSKRKSSTDFSGKKIPLTVILDIISASAGNKENNLFKRFHPSGGGLYPVEVYYLDFNMLNNEEVCFDIYHFSPIDHTLSLFKTIKRNYGLSKLIGSSYSFMDKSSGYLIFTLTPRRTFPKYGWLGLRLGLIEVGTIIQNIYLVCSTLHLKCCAIGGFNAQKADELLDIDGLNEMTVMTMLIGE